jgi:nicotinamidase-related amidase
MNASTNRIVRPGDVAESPRILTPDNSMLILIDHQPNTLLGIQSHDRQTLINNVTGLAKTAKIFGLPVILTTVAAKTFTGPILPELTAVFPEEEVIDRSSLNAWADIREKVAATGRRKLIIAGMWTELCLTLPTLSAIEEGYEVYFVPDASGSGTLETHQMGIQRMIQAGATPVTWIGVLSELQYDWAHKATYDAVNRIAQEHGGAFGASINLVRAMTAQNGAH